MQNEAGAALEIGVSDGSSEESLREAWLVLDADGDGKVGRYEIIKACNSSEVVRSLLGLPADIKKSDGSREKLNRLMERLDADNTGKVTLPEFLRVFNPAVAEWLEFAGVVAEPADEMDAVAFRKLQRRNSLRAADDAADFVRDGPGRRVEQRGAAGVNALMGGPLAA